VTNHARASSDAGVRQLLQGSPHRATARRGNHAEGVSPSRRRDGRTLPESDAIIWYLAEGTKLAPENQWDRAQALQWMFFEQYSHEPYVAVARFWLKFAAKEDLAKKQHLVGEWHDRGNAALGVMNTHLKTHDWFGGPRYSIADIALYGYTHCAADGGFELSEYPAVVKWLARVAAEPGHIPLDESW
jgi:glutathione S-transferase